MLRRQLFGMAVVRTVFETGLVFLVLVLALAEKSCPEIPSTARRDPAFLERLGLSVLSNLETYSICCGFDFSCVTLTVFSARSRTMRRNGLIASSAGSEVNSLLSLISNPIFERTPGVAS